MNPTIISSGPGPEVPVSMPSAAGGRSGSGGPRKWIIVGGVLMAVALILGVIAVILIPKGDNGSSSLSAADAYVQLYNYMIYGDVNGGDERNDAFFEVITRDESKSAQDEFFNKANEYMDVIRNKAPNKASESVMALVDGIKVAREVSSVAYTNVVTTEFLAEGSNGLTKHLEENQKLNLDGSSLYYTAVMVVEKDLIEKLNELYTIYQKNNCIVDGAYDGECMDEVLKNEEAENLLTEAIELRLKLRSYAESIVARVLNLLDAVGEEI